MQSGKKSICSDDGDTRKWLLGHLHIIQAKALASNLDLPKIYKEKIEAVPDSNPNEINLNGESLLIATIKYLDDKENRVRCVFIIINII
ncbi:unnamed protein product [Brugia pahangi]|uniref:POLAc domain-containing protein n=1 Tax=Brugia pahangi TaxID=6280 RepID=A0A0N4TDJ0_BRUPA|nr:unnamed protein product [Brugia pahangi]